MARFGERDRRGGCAWRSGRAAWVRAAAAGGSHAAQDGGEPGDCGRAPTGPVRQLPSLLLLLPSLLLLLLLLLLRGAPGHVHSAVVVTLGLRALGRSVRCVPGAISSISKPASRIIWWSAEAWLPGVVR